MWDGCVDRLDPAWKLQDEDPDTINPVAPEYDSPLGLDTSGDDE